MKTINIRGKEYITVNERLKEFRNNFKDYSLTTEIVELGADNCTMKATITDDKGVVRATGFAREVVAKSPINKFAFVENCETSAIGRALGNFGIGIDTAICTADELLMKLSQEEEPKKTPAQKAAETRKANILKKEITLDAFSKAMEYLDTVDSVESVPAEKSTGIESTIMSLAHWGFMDQYNQLNQKWVSKDSIPF